MRNFEPTRSVTIGKEITKDWARTGTTAFSTKNQLKLTQNHDRHGQAVFSMGMKYMANAARNSKGGGTGEDYL